VPGSRGLHRPWGWRGATGRYMYGDYIAAGPGCRGAGRGAEADTARWKATEEYRRAGPTADAAEFTEMPTFVSEWLDGDSGLETPPARTLVTPPAATSSCAMPSVGLPSAQRQRRRALTHRQRPGGLTSQRGARTHDRTQIIAIQSGMAQARAGRVYRPNSFVTGQEPKWCSNS
jgi:hypothetical protein